MLTSFASHPVRRTVTRSLAAASAALVLVALTACAPTSGSEVEIDSGTSELSVADWRQNMDDCMLKAGFDIAVPVAADGSTTGSVDTSTFDMVEFDKAYGVCMKEVGEYPGDDSLPSEEELFDAQLIFAACMREAGYDYPDPVKGSGGMGQAFGPETDANVVDGCSSEAYSQFDAQ